MFEVIAWFAIVSWLIAVGVVVGLAFYTLRGSRSMADAERDAQRHAELLGETA